MSKGIIYDPYGQPISSDDFDDLFDDVDDLSNAIDNLIDNLQRPRKPSCECR